MLGSRPATLFQLTRASRAKDQPVPKFTYAPKDHEPQTFDFQFDDLDSLEAERIEEAGGEQWRTFGEWMGLIDRGGVRAWRAALWILLQRQTPKLAFEELVIKVGDITFEVDTDVPEGKGESGDESTDSP